jgi:Dehydrogenases with different specificities (related to short-chain alcohol dehydrogenases)
MKLKDKVAIVTGGTGALGKAVVVAFLEEGAKAVCTYVVDKELEELLALIRDDKQRLFPIKADVTKKNKVARVVAKTVEKFGRIDILANIVGGFVYSMIADTSEKDWDQMMSMNLNTAFLCSKAVLPHMMGQDYGKIIVISSRPGLKGAAGVGAYAASKAGVLNLTETIAEEVKDYDINVNAVLPSTIDTPGNRRAMPEADFSKWVKPEEIARVIVFLSSDDSKPISGAGIPVYGKA